MLFYKKLQTIKDDQRNFKPQTYGIQNQNNFFDIPNIYKPRWRLGIGIIW